MAAPVKLGSDMRRRDFLGVLGGSVAWPLTARAQKPERMRRIGILMGLAEDDPETIRRLAKLRQELVRFGWTEGSNVLANFDFDEVQLGSGRISIERVGAHAWS